MEQRLSQISSNQKCFEAAKHQYEEALNKAGHKSKLEYKAASKHNKLFNAEGSRTKRKRKNRKTIWFNPPHSDTVATNVGRLFLNAVEKHFGSDKDLKKLFNRNNVKVSYSCGRNLKQDIQHNIRKNVQQHRQSLGQPSQHDRTGSRPRN